MVMHFLGGLWVGVTFMWLYSFVLKKDVSINRRILRASFFGVLIIIISWEVFELFIQNNISDPNFLSDTLSDMLLGILGGFVAYRYFIFNFIENNS